MFVGWSLKEQVLRIIDSESESHIASFFYQAASFELDSEDVWDQESGICILVFFETEICGWD